MNAKAKAKIKSKSDGESASASEFDGLFKRLCQSQKRWTVRWVRLVGQGGGRRGGRGGFVAGGEELKALCLVSCA